MLFASLWFLPHWRSHCTHFWTKTLFHSNLLVHYTLFVLFVADRTFFEASSYSCTSWYFWAHTISIPHFSCSCVLFKFHVNQRSRCYEFSRKNKYKSNLVCLLRHLSPPCSFHVPYLHITTSALHRECSLQLLRPVHHHKSDRHLHRRSVTATIDSVTIHHLHHHFPFP
jgi:hypothetical protein